MGLFDKLFEKKTCDICGKELGLLGKRKLEDGNICKDCASKLSPWFSDRRRSTVAEIEDQLAYREENKKAVEAFHVTLSLGKNMKVLMDEDAAKFMVTRERNYKDANPDVLDFGQVTGCHLDIEERRTEEMREDSEGKEVSYMPPRYFYSYDFHMIIQVNHPYFDEIAFDLNSYDVEINPGRGMTTPPNPQMNHDYREYEEMGREIKEILTQVRKQVREDVKAAAAPKAAVNCPYCGATTVPDASGCCEYCGGAL
jgi:hypothetical protein